MNDTGQLLDAASARHGLVIGLAGWSGSGKTTLAEQLIAGLTARGLEVATIKHAHHGFDADKPGKDSYRHRAAGARQVVVSSQARSVLFTENRDRGERRLEELLDALSPADIVIVEGFKREPIPKIEIFRLATGKPPLFTADPQIIAVATDDANALPTTPPHLLDLNDVGSIIAYVCERADAGTIAAAS
jgi:molybdopterin-guanine dinucleotide biosynthesis protein B